MVDYLQWAAIALLLALKLLDGRHIRALERRADGFRAAFAAVDEAVERLFEGLMQTNKGAARLSDGVAKAMEVLGAEVGKGAA